MPVARPTSLLAVLIAVVLAVLAVLASPPSLSAPAQAASTTSAAHPYSDPSWFPLRKPARVGCALSGCGTAADHGYWAVDLLGAKGDPVHAAGAGIAHIGGNRGGCVAKAKDHNGGRWLWIDHGGGVVTRYHHLDSIAVKEGQLVTPATRIGGMGSTGDISPCTTNYLHFEVRHGGLKGARVDPGPLQACTAAGRVSLPGALGGRSWNDPAIHPTPRLWTSASTSACIPASWLSTPARPSTTVRRASKAITVNVSALPSDATGWVVRRETYHPSTRAWGSVVHRTVGAGSRSTVFTDVDNTHAYRVSVAVKDTGGWSAWSGRRNAVGAPVAPRSPRYLTWPKKDYVHYGWHRPDNLGSKVASFTVARRCAKSGGAYGAWKSYTQGQKDTYRNVRGLSAYTTCRVKVRATNANGTGPWSKTSTVKR